MAHEQNEKTVRRFLSIIDSKDFDSLAEVIHHDYAHYGASGKEPWASDLRGASGAKKWFTEVFRDHPTFKTRVQDIFGEGDRIAVRFVVEEGGKPTSNGIACYRLLDGRIAEDWPCFQEIRA